MPSSPCMRNALCRIRSEEGRTVRALLKLVKMTVTRTGLLAVKWRQAAKCRNYFGYWPGNTCREIRCEEQGKQNMVLQNLFFWVCDNIKAVYIIVNNCFTKEMKLANSSKSLFQCFTFKKFKFWFSSIL